MAILANVDSSILNLNLENGFTIKEMSLKDAVDLVTKLEGKNFSLALGDFYHFLPKNKEFILENEKLYYISYSFFAESDNIKERFNDFNEIEMFEFEYVIPLLQLVRIYKEGNISIFIRYYYSKDDFSLSMRPNYNIILSSEKFTIENSEISDLNRFLENIELPFDEFLQLAFENFNLSYDVPHINLQFLSLMNGLEALFHPSHEGELTYRISRNIAVLLGDKAETAVQIQKEMKDLYRKRSKIVHRGKADIDNNDLLKLRHYTRESIKEIYRIGKNKDDLLKMLNSCGFGQRPWRDES
jgi:hypothetical protein